MALSKVFSLLATASVCLILLAGGCAGPAEGPVVTEPEVAEPAVAEPAVAEPAVPEPAVVEPQAVEPTKTKIEPQPAPPPVGEAVTVALKFVADDVATYRAVTESARSVKFEGALENDPNLKGGVTSNRAQTTFTQQIQSVDDKGNAVAKITITGLKYLAKVKDSVVRDFDSSREKDKGSPLMKLIGQSYTIKLTPLGGVAEVIDVKEAQAAVKGSSSAHKTALALLKPDVIKQRHSIPALPDADKNQVRAGDNWSRTKSFAFGLMGPKSYEKIYTVKDIKHVGARKIAVVEMNAIPTSQMPEQMKKEQALTSSFSKMFDNIETYTGEMKLDLTTGKVEKYSEMLKSEWIVVDPAAKPEDDKPPGALKMGVTRFYSLEKID